MRIAILGNSGSGKSTLARALATRHDLPVLDLDLVAWVPGEIAVPRPADEAAADVRAFCAADRWVVEGCYAGLVAMAIEAGGLLVLLDLPVEVCVANCRARPWEPHKYASAAEQDARLAALLDWVRAYDERDGDLSRAGHRALFAQHRGPKVRLAARPTEADLAELADIARPAAPP